MQLSFCETTLQYDTNRMRQEIMEKHESKMRTQRQLVDKGERVGGPLLEPLTEQQLEQQVQRMLKHPVVNVHLVKPESFMNRSGAPLRSYIDSKLYASGLLKCLKGQASAKNAPARVLVVCDDMTLPFGQMKLKYKGGDGGHNGLASVQQRLGSDRYHRLKLGIAPTDERMQGRRIVLHDYVLKKFNSYDEMPTMPVLLDQACRVILEYLHFDMNSVANKANSIVVEPRRAE